MSSDLEIYCGFEDVRNKLGRVIRNGGTTGVDTEHAKLLRWLL